MAGEKLGKFPHVLSVSHGINQDRLSSPLLRSRTQEAAPAEWQTCLAESLPEFLFFFFQAFDDIAKYFSKEEWEKMKSSEKIVYVYMKLNYEVMTKLGNRKF